MDVREFSAGRVLSYTAVSQPDAMPVWSARSSPKESKTSVEATNLSATGHRNFKKNLLWHVPVSGSFTSCYLFLKIFSPESHTAHSFACFKSSPTSYLFSGSLPSPPIGSCISPFLRPHTPSPASLFFITPTIIWHVLFSCYLWNVAFMQESVQHMYVQFRASI